MIAPSFSFPWGSVPFLSFSEFCSDTLTLACLELDWADRKSSISHDNHWGRPSPSMKCWVYSCSKPALHSEIPRQHSGLDMPWYEHSKASSKKAAYKLLRSESFEAVSSLKACWICRSWCHCHWKLRVSVFQRLCSRLASLLKVLAKHKCRLSSLIWNISREYESWLTRDFQLHGDVRLHRLHIGEQHLFLVSPLDPL